MTTYTLIRILIIVAGIGWCGYVYWRMRKDEEVPKWQLYSGMASAAIAAGAIQTFMWNGPLYGC